MLRGFSESYFMLGMQRATEKARQMQHVKSEFLHCKRTSGTLTSAQTGSHPPKLEDAKSSSNEVQVIELDESRTDALTVRLQSESDGGGNAGAESSQIWGFDGSTLDLLTSEGEEPKSEEASSVDRRRPKSLHATGADKFQEKIFPSN